ncbi:TniQ family protein [Mycobacteroides abscessus]|uniref:TniQ family protein n=1 Tax=Mycobacteroides abscessus TaxID=36809 RepID=UPI000C25B675|nr:TniQ family protein [Mycobacteroides abscessus]
MTTPLHTPIVRTLPIRMEPVDGEALDSWLEALSFRLATTWGDLVAATGLPKPDGNRAFPPLIALLPEEADALALATGKDPGFLQLLTLARYHRTGLAIRSGVRLVDRTFPWSRSRFSRFCPDCLRDSSGRWSLFWRLGWAFACETHRCLLVDECPRCRCRQRERPMPADLIPHPGHCAIPAPQATGRAPARCDADLTTAATLRFDADHPVLAAQRQIAQIIRSGTASFGIYRNWPVDGAGALADVRAVAGRILAYATEQDLQERLPADLHAAYCELGTRVSDPGAAPRPDAKPGMAAPAHAITAAAAVTAALNILGSASIESAGAAMRWLITGARTSGLAVNTSNIGWGRRTTTTLTGTQLAALAPLMNPSDQLRYRIGTPLPTRPADDEAIAAAITAKLPAAMWPAWVVRLAPAGLEYQRLSTALPCAVLLVNTRLTLTKAAEAMGRGGGGHSLSHILQRLEAVSCWNSLREAFIELAEYLHTHEIPIDYTRRRALDYSRLLPDDEWIQICQGAGIRSGDGKKAAVARCYLYATISGNPARRAPGFIDTNDFVSALANFPAQMTSRLAEALDQCAQIFLYHNNITEPVTWCPPLGLVAGLDLPGADPETVDIRQLRRLLHRSLTLSAIAEKLGTSLEVVRYRLSQHPVPEQLRNPATWPSPSIDQLARKLSAMQLSNLYHDQNLSARQIAARYGVSRQTVVRLVRQYGLDVRPAHTPRRHVAVKRDWLYTEYVINRRTLPELAAETGMSTMNMARWAKFHGIERRGRGGPSHTANINSARAAQLAPEILRPALEQIGGDQRLSRFAAASTHPTVTAAAATLGLHQPVLHGQIKRLERELGGPLLECAQRGRPMTLTALGDRVLDAWRHWNAAPRP